MFGKQSSNYRVTEWRKQSAATSHLVQLWSNTKNPLERSVPLKCLTVSLRVLLPSANPVTPLGLLITVKDASTPYSHLSFVTQTLHSKFSWKFCPFHLNPITSHHLCSHHPLLPGSPRAALVVMRQPKCPFWAQVRICDVAFQTSQWCPISLENKMQPPYCGLHIPK